MEGRKLVSWKDNISSATIKRVNDEFGKKIEKAQAKRILIHFFPNEEDSEISELYGKNGKYIIDVLQEKLRDKNPDVMILNINGDFYKSVLHRSRKSVLPTYLYHVDGETKWIFQADELVLGVGYDASKYLTDGLLRGRFQVRDTCYAPHRDEVVENLVMKINKNTQD